MARKIPQETRKEINRLYDEGLRPSEIARQTGVSYASVYGMTKVRQRENPETVKQFASLGELQYYNARQRENPETGKQFASRGEYEAYQARQRSKKSRNKELSYLIKKRLKWIGVNQSWLAKKMDVSREAVRLYVAGRSIPKGENLRKLLDSLEIRKLPKCLDDLVED